MTFEEWWPYHPTKGEFDADDMRAAYAAGVASQQAMAASPVNMGLLAQLADARAEITAERQTNAERADEIDGLQGEVHSLGAEIERLKGALMTISRRLNDPDEIGVGARFLLLNAARAALEEKPADE